MNVTLKALALVVLATSMLSACNACSKKKSGRNNAAVAPSSPEPTPEPAPTPGPKPSNEDVGEEHPPITPDAPSSIDTAKSAALKHLIFETTNTQEAGRYLSEYLIAIFSREESCVRLKVRPTNGVSNEVDKAVLQNGNEGTGACEGQKIIGEEKSAPAAPPQPGEGDVETEGASLRQHMELAELEFIDPSRPLSPERSFALAGQSAGICSSRIFRMKTAVSAQNPLARVTHKTGQLVHVGSRVRLWVDDEYTNACPGTSVAIDSKSPFGYGLLVQQGVSWLDNYRAKMWLAHVQSLAGEMDKIIADMTGTFGPISDIDGSGYIEIFMSPDVNRTQFIPYDTTWPDHFRARHEFKPEDLAYFNSETNPVSNEGEILYMFAPDQGGIYNKVQYPSPDSVATNFAKGFLSAQTMNLIIANQKLFVQKQKKMEDLWLSESLAALASMYYAGNDYMFANLAQFLTSRPQYISINNGPDAKLLTAAYLAMGGDEAQGMRGFFGWYLHTRLCGSNTVEPCAKIKSFIDSKEYGIKSVETLLGESFDNIMINFTLSVGIGMTRNPQNVLAFWDKGTPGLPAKPLLFPALAEIYRVPVTEESDGNATLLAAAKTDRTQAGPYPSRDSLLFQAITSDNDMEFKTTANSVSFVLVTSLVETTTDVTAFFGKGLNVTFMPIGERDPENRRVFIEKVSEYAHRDLRPVNLTNTVNPDQTNRFDRAYENIDYSITPSRELWILGSIDNYTENVNGSQTIIGDTDAYTLEINPCEGLSGADLVTCQGQNHTALIQVHIRDFEKELAPMAILTEPDPTIYRGMSVVGRVVDIDKEHQEPPFTTDYLCQAASMWDPLASAMQCDNGGFGTMQPVHNNLLTLQDQSAFQHNYFNYLMMSPKGFPFPNINSIWYRDMPPCENFQCYQSVEHLRQHYIFKFDKMLKPYSYRFFPNNGIFKLPNENATFLSSAEVTILASLKAKIATTPCIAPTAEFVDECSAIAAVSATDCENICSAPAAFESKVKNWIIDETKVAICRSASCPDALALTLDDLPHTTAWLPLDHYVTYVRTVATTMSTYLPPAEPSDSTYCQGDAGGTPQLTCTIRHDYLPTIVDIRQQFNVLTNEMLIGGCALGTIGTDFRVCFDDQSWVRETAPDRPYAFAFGREKLSTDRTRQYYYSITSRAGEVISKPERIQMLYFRVPGTGSTVNVIVGGRKETQGKYLIRARLKAFEVPYHP